MAEKINLYPEDIELGLGRRRLNEAKVRALVDSISKIGLQTPITVWFEGPTADRAHLVTGAHRVEACRRLGLDMDAIVTAASEIDRDLWEIDENLCRSELTEAEEAQHLARRKELWEAREKSSNKLGQVVPVSGGRGHKGFAEETSSVTGQDKRTINRKISRAEKIEPEVLEQVKGTQLDKGTVLDQLAKTPREEQRAKVVELRESQESKHRRSSAEIHGGRFSHATSVFLHTVRAFPEQFQVTEIPSVDLSTGLDDLRRARQLLDELIAKIEVTSRGPTAPAAEVRLNTAEKQLADTVTAENAWLASEVRHQ